MPVRHALLALSLALFGCAGDDGPPLAVENVAIYAPLPGSRAAAAYLDLINRSDEDITIAGITSAAFARVEIHESRLEDGVASMRPVGSLVIPAGRTVVLRPQSLHLMLMEPIGDADVGDSVSLRIRYDAAGEIIVRSTLQSRVRLETN